MSKNNGKIVKKISRDFIKGLKIVKRKSKKPVIVAMVGLVGSSKGYTARALSNLIGATVVRGDSIRVALRKKNQDFAPTRIIAEKVALALIKKGANVIMDSDFINSQKRKRIEEKAKKAKARVVYIRTVADRDIMIGRLVKARYNSNKDLFKTNAIALREMWRRTPHHYRWESAQGGRFIPRKLRILFLAEIDTGESKWKKEIAKAAKKINSL